jgi:hypothetical protein
MSSLLEIHTDVLDILNTIRSPGEKDQKIFLQQLDTQLQTLATNVYNLHLDEVEDKQIGSGSLHGNPHSRRASRASSLMVTRRIRGSNRSDSVALLASTVRNILEEEEHINNNDGDGGDGGDDVKNDRLSRGSIISTNQRRIPAIARRSKRRSSMADNQNVKTNSQHTLAARNEYNSKQHILSTLMTSNANYTANGHIIDTSTGHLVQIMKEINDTNSFTGIERYLLYCLKYYRKNKKIMKLIMKRNENKNYIRRALHLSLAHEPRAISL